MIQSYLTGEEYGYDQISVGSDEFNETLKTLDTNSIHKIPTIREREMRLFNKMNNYEDNRKKLAPFDVCDPNLFSLGGVQRKNLRDNMKENIERYYYGTGDSENIQLKYAKKRTCDHYPQIITDEPMKREPMINPNDMEYLQEEMDELERKNNILVLFIFFLVVIVLVQYSKSNNDPMKVLILPESVTKTTKEAEKTDQ